jgi:hypothetical protein
MPWSTTRKPGTAAKYRTKEHRDLRAHWVRRINAGEYVECTADECVLDSRQIANTNGRDRDGLHLGHENDGVTYRGPQHNACNVRHGAQRGNARSRGLDQPLPRTPRRWVI